MSGHSKWANIKHKKARSDEKRGKEFTKIAKDITIAVRTGHSGDPDSNSKLKLAIQKAKAEGQRLLIISGNNRIDLTDVAFMYARNNPEKLKAEIKKTIDTLLNLK